MIGAMSNHTWAQRDLNVLWHPCTQMHDHESLPPIPIRRGQGVWLEDFDGHLYLDAISSWWVNLFGHAHPGISNAIKTQLEDLEQVILAGFSHAPIIALSEQLVAMSPPGLSRCFYADSGSAAVEIALKMSFHYWQNVGKKHKIGFLSLRNSYHGETLGALAVGDVALYKETYGPLLFKHRTVMSPDCYHRAPGESCAAYSTRAFADMQETLERHADEICAVIVEPLVQCAGGMRMYDPVYLSLLRNACDHFGVHLIADEIAVGFGRTGTLFACEQAGITPDFLCLGKGLTGGYLPLSACLTTNAVYRAFYGEYASGKAFLHSHSYTGNPLACAAALATLKIFKDDNIIIKNKKLSAYFNQQCAPLEHHPHIAEVRQTGMIVALEMVRDKAHRIPFAWQERRGREVYKYALNHGVVLRPLGDVIYFMPPYVINENEIRQIVTVAHDGINLACASPR